MSKAQKEDYKVKSDADRKRFDTQKKQQKLKVVNKESEQNKEESDILRGGEIMMIAQNVPEESFGFSTPEKKEDHIQYLPHR